MARIRTIKPDFWRDEQLSMISPEACLLAIGLLNHCDDEGYFNANPKLVESDVFPLRELSNTTTVLIQELSNIGYLDLFQGEDGKTYGHIRNFEKHQVINKKTPSKIKNLCNLPYDYHTTTVVLPTGMERNGKEKEKESKKTVVAPEGVSIEVWKAFTEQRKKARAVVTDLVIDQIRKEASKINWTLEQAMIECVTRGWRGFKADWIKQPVNIADIARMTVPSTNERDPALVKLDQDKKLTAPPPPEIMAKIKEVLRK